MKSLKWISIFAIFVVTLVSCKYYSREKKDNFNDNSYIIKEMDFSTHKGRELEKSLRIIDGIVKSSFIISYNEFIGTETIWDIQSFGKGKLTFYYTSRISGGKIKGVFINDKNIVTNVFSEDIKDGLVIGLNKGNYRIKLVGDNFSGKVSMTIIGEGDIEAYINSK